VDPFEHERPRLMAIAYRMLGSRAEAEDVVQDAWLRFRDSRANTIEDVPRYLCTVVTRLCLDELKSARARRERYVGSWLPEPWRDDGAARAPMTVIDRESLSTALLLLLERLTPQERAAWILHEVFDYSHAEIAAMLDAGEPACRQWLHRARQHLADERPRFARSPEEHGLLLATFLDACARGDLDRLRELLARDARAISDGGGKAQAALNIVEGADHVARLLAGLARRFAGALTPEPVELNGWPAVLLRDGDKLDSTLAIETDGTHVYAVHMVRNPDKLTRL
jgi:RNA polymerase sigma-70 factor (ECF subfamily)